MQATNAAPAGAGKIANPYYAYGAPAVFAPLTDEAGEHAKRRNCSLDSSPADLRKTVPMYPRNVNGR